MRKFKLIFTYFVSVALLFFLPVSCSAFDSNIDDYDQEYDFGSFISTLSDDTLAILDEIGIDELSLDDIFSVDPSKVFDALLGMVVKAVKEPVRFMSVVMGIVIIVTLMGSFLDSPKTLNMVGGATLSLCTAVPVAGVVTSSFSVLETLNAFTTAFSGVFCAVVSSSGRINMGVSYATLTVFSDTLFSAVLSGVSQPVVNLTCSLGFLSCFDMGGFTEKISQIVRKLYVFVLSFIGTVFSGIVTLKGVLSDGEDTLGARSIRFVVGRSLPVVGGTVSETYSTLVSSLSLIKNTVGVFGIITVAVTVLPTLLQLLGWIFALEACATVSDILGAEGSVNMLRVLKDTFILLVATITIVATVFIVSVGVVITVKGGGV